MKINLLAICLVISGFLSCSGVKESQVSSLDSSDKPADLLDGQRVKFRNGFDLPAYSTSTLLKFDIPNRSGFYAECRIDFKGNHDHMRHVTTDHTYVIRLLSRTPTLPIELQDVDGIAEDQQPKDPFLDCWIKQENEIGQNSPLPTQLVEFFSWLFVYQDYPSYYAEKLPGWE